MIFEIPTVLVFGEVRAFSTGLQKFVSYLDHGVLKFNIFAYVPYVIWLLLVEYF